MRRGLGGQEGLPGVGAADAVDVEMVGRLEVADCGVGMGAEDSVGTAAPNAKVLGDKPLLHVLDRSATAAKP
jgi:hypothetical protein